MTSSNMYGSLASRLGAGTNTGFGVNKVISLQVAVVVLQTLDPATGLRYPSTDAADGG